MNQPLRANRRGVLVCGLLLGITARIMPSMRGVPKVAVTWFGLVGSLLLVAAVGLAGASVSDAPEDFIARGFRDLFQTGAVVGGIVNLVGALSVWKGWRWVGVLVALSGLAMSVLLLFFAGWPALVPVVGYVVCIASLLGLNGART